MLFSIMYFERNETDGFTQLIRASGIKKFPLMYNKTLSIKVCCCFLGMIPLLIIIDFFLEKQARRADSLLVLKKSSL